MYLYIYIAFLAVHTPIRSAASARDPERREHLAHQLIKWVV